MNIIELAKEAGGHVAELPNGDAWLFEDDAMLKRFAALVRAEALEEAAKWLAESGLIGSNDCAAAIRGLK